MTYILSFVLVFTAVIIVHEFGHFLAARITGVKVYEFSIGFPFTQKLITIFSHRETAFTVRLLPLGGFVAFSKDDSDLAFLEEPRWKRAFITISGPAFNLIFAFLIISLALVIGKDMGLFPAAVKSAGTGAAVLSGTLHAVTNLLSGTIDGISGPIGIAMAAGKASEAGLFGLLYFTGLLSLSLAVFNLLPLPALDGGTLLILAVESIRGRRLGNGAYNVLGFIGVSFLLILTLIASFGDVFKLAS